MFHILAGIRDAHSLKLRQSLLCASNLSAARQGALSHLYKWCHLKSCFPITKKQIVFGHTPWCALHSVLFHFRLALWLMRIKKRILPIRKQGNVLIHTGKDPDLSPTSSSQLLSISSYGDADMLRRGFANKIRRLLFGFLPFVVSHQPLNAGVLSWNRMHCYTVCFQYMLRSKRTYRPFQF